MADERPAPRGAVLPWAVAVVALLVAAGAATGWALSGGKAKPAPDGDERYAVLEAKNQELVAENQRLRRPADVPATNPPGTKKGGTNDSPKLEEKKDDRARFVGAWSLVADELRKEDAEIELEFRADGTCTFVFRVAGMSEEKSGTWKWEAGKLVFDASGGDEPKPAAVTWSGPDEFAAEMAPGKPVTFRRKGKRADPPTPAAEPKLALGTHGDWEIQLVRLEFVALGSGSCVPLGTRPSEHLVVALRGKCLKDTEIKAGLYGFPTFAVQGQTDPLPLRGMALKLAVEKDRIVVSTQQGMLGISKSGKRKVGDIEEFVAVVEVGADAAAAMAAKGVRLQVQGFIPGVPKIDVPVVIPGKLGVKP